jgi:hypothetical protein
VILRALFLLILLTSPGFVLGQARTPQDSVSFLQVDTKDGHRYIGKVREINVERIILEVGPDETVTIDPLNIRRATVVNPLKFRKGKYWLDNGQSSRYFWGPSGYGLSSGTGYYQNVDLVANQVAYGFTNHFSVTAGVMPLWFLFNPTTNFWIMPKVSAPLVREKINVSGGFYFGSSVSKYGAGPGENGILLGYGVLTFGSRDNNVSIGTVYGQVRSIRMKQPALMLSYMFRMGPTLYMMGENYVLPDPYGRGLGGIMSFGVRKVTKRATLELAVGTYLSMEAYYFLPSLGIVVPFGRRVG